MSLKARCLWQETKGKLLHYHRFILPVLVEKGQGSLLHEAQAEFRSRMKELLTWHMIYFLLYEGRAVSYQPQAGEPCAPDLSDGTWVWAYHSVPRNLEMYPGPGPPLMGYSIFFRVGSASNSISTYIPSFLE